MELVGHRVRLDNFDHDEGFLPLEGTVRRRCATTTGVDDWYLVDLAEPIELQRQLAPEFRFELWVIHQVLIRSRWAGVPLGPDTQPSVFLLLVREGQTVSEEPIAIDEFVHICWARCTVVA